jgi:hypothetical protein
MKPSECFGCNLLRFAGVPCDPVQQASQTAVPRVKERIEISTGLSGHRY